MIFLEPDKRMVKKHERNPDKFHVALHASHAALPMVTLTISPCTNVTLTLGWITLFWGDMGDGALHREDEVTVKQ
jgi:hypothetical protein